MAISERQKMLAGELYVASDPELVAGRTRARQLWQRFNGSAPENEPARLELLRELLGRIGPGAWIEPPF